MARKTRMSPLISYILIPTLSPGITRALMNARVFYRRAALPPCARTQEESRMINFALETQKSPDPRLWKLLINDCEAPAATNGNFEAAKILCSRYSYTFVSRDNCRNRDIRAHFARNTGGGDGELVIRIEYKHADRQCCFFFYIWIFPFLGKILNADVHDLWNGLSH